MSILGEIKQDELILAGFTLDEYGSYYGDFKSPRVEVTIEDSYKAWNAWDVKLEWYDVKSNVFNVQQKTVYCEKDELFEEARKVVFEFSDGCLDICKLNRH